MTKVLSILLKENYFQIKTIMDLMSMKLHLALIASVFFFSCRNSSVDHHSASTSVQDDTIEEKIIKDSLISYSIVCKSSVTAELRIATVYFHENLESNKSIPNLFAVKDQVLSYFVDGKKVNETKLPFTTLIVPLANGKDEAILPVVVHRVKALKKDGMAIYYIYGMDNNLTSEFFGYSDSDGKWIYYYYGNKDEVYKKYGDDNDIIQLFGDEASNLDKMLIVYPPEK